MNVGTDNDEFVAAEARESVVGAQHCLQSWSEHRQDLVPGCVTMVVVDPLEVVEVEEQDGNGRAASLRVGKGALDPIVE